MDNRKETPISEMDDQALQIHALGVAYREAERRREEADQRREKTEKRSEEAEKQCEKLRLEIRDLDAGAPMAAAVASVERTSTGTSNFSLISYAAFRKSFAS